MAKKIKELAIGDYELRIVKKGKNEAFIEGLKQGDMYFTIKIDKGTYMDVPSQVNAEIISRLVRIERLLSKRNK